MNKATATTAEKVELWIFAKQRVKEARDRLNSAECDLFNATNELGKWLVPPDAQVDERFNIWFGSGILQSHRKDAMSSDYEVRWRKEPEGKQAIEQGV